MIERPDAILFASKFSRMGDEVSRTKRGNETNKPKIVPLEVRSSRNSNRRASAARQSATRKPDDIDRRLLEALLEDSRLSVRELAARIQVSRANAHWRLTRLRDAGVIRAFTVDIDPEALGLGVAAIVIISVDQPNWRAASEQLRAMPEVEYLAFAAGEFDAIAVVRAPDMTTFRDIVLERLLSIPYVRATRTLFILEEFRRKPVLA